MISFKEIVDGNIKFREFDSNTDQDDFNWHLDHLDREVLVI